MQCAARRHLGRRESDLPQEALLFCADAVAAAALGNAHRFVEVLNAVPFPAFLHDHLQNTQLAVNQVVARFPAAFFLIPPEVTYIDVLDQDRLQENGSGV